jgi:hypothetical protein
MESSLWWFQGTYSRMVASMIKKSRDYTPLPLWEEKILQEDAAIIDAFNFLERNRTFIDSPPLY